MRTPVVLDPFGDWHEDPCDDSPERAADIAGLNARESGRELE